jgi:hypothetical protein
VRRRPAPSPTTLHCLLSSCLQASLLLGGSCSHQRSPPLPLMRPVFPCRRRGPFPRRRPRPCPITPDDPTTSHHTAPPLRLTCGHLKDPPSGGSLRLASSSAAGLFPGGISRGQRRNGTRFSDELLSAPSMPSSALLLLLMCWWPGSQHSESHFSFDDSIFGQYSNLRYNQYL